MEEDPFNPDYVEVDRVLDMAEHTDPNTGKSIKHYLVKWRSLQYEDSTWELEEDIDPIKIQLYQKFNKLPPKDQWKVMFLVLKRFYNLKTVKSVLVLHVEQFNHFLVYGTATSRYLEPLQV